MAFRLAFEKAFEDIADSSWLAKLTDWLLEPFSFFFRGYGLQHSSFRSSFRPLASAETERVSSGIAETDNDKDDDDKDIDNQLGYNLEYIVQFC